MQERGVGFFFVFIDKCLCVKCTIFCKKNQYFRQVDFLHEKLYIMYSSILVTTCNCLIRHKFYSG